MLLRYLPIVIAFVVAGTNAQAVPPPPSTSPTLQVPDDATEEFFIERIKKLDAPKEKMIGPQGKLTSAAARKHQLVLHIDELIKRFPETEFKEEALITKLKALARLARVDKVYLRDLLTFTNLLSIRGVTGNLAEENDFYSIQAFVLGARVEQMPKNRQLMGTFERYEAFLEDHPTSKRVPIIRASLIRNAIEMGKIERAERELVTLKEQFPDHIATKRAAGEVYRITAVGKPFDFSYPMQDGSVLNSKDYRGKVLLVHFWAFWHKPSFEQLRDVGVLNKLYNDKGLELIGVSLDKECGWLKGARKTSNMTWPICCEGKGVEGDVAISHGVTKLPAYYIIDRKGILRTTDPGDKLREIVEKLLTEDVKEQPAPKDAPK